MRTLLLLTLSLPLLAGGCALEDGRGFARLSAELRSGFRGLDPALGRTLAGGWFKTSSSFALQLSGFELVVRELRLLRVATVAAAASPASCSFDPQDPPFGCTLCHNDHCHCDGELRSYDELRAELCGAGGAAATSSTVARLPVGAPQGLLGAGTRQELASCLPSCELGAGAIDELRLVLDRLRLTGIVRDDSSANRLGGSQPTVVVDWELGGAAIPLELARAGGAIPIDRDHPYHLRLEVSFPVSEKLLDAVAWEGLTRGADGGIVIDAKQNGPAGEAITQSLAATVLGVVTTRAD